MPASRGLQHGHYFTRSKANGCQMKRKEAVKVNNVAAKAAVDFAIWCEHCSIRIAPNEKRIALKNKTYHERCYAKSKPIAGDENEHAV